MGTKLSLLQESGQGRLAWQTPKPDTTENITPAKNEEAPNKMPLKLAEAWPRNTNWQVSESDKNCQQWEAEMEKLNNKYNLDCFSDSELDLESDEGEE